MIDETTTETPLPEHWPTDIPVGLLVKGETVSVMQGDGSEVVEPMLSPTWINDPTWGHFVNQQSDHTRQVITDSLSNEADAAQILADAPPAPPAPVIADPGQHPADGPQTDAQPQPNLPAGFSPQTA
jgi:hypothetical protein